MSLVTVDEVEAANGTDLTDDQYALVETIIPLVEGTVEAYLGRTITPTEQTEEHSLSQYETLIYLRNTPVRSVSAVTANGNTVDASQWSRTRWGVVLLGWGYSLPVLTSAAWISPTADYNITYIGGLDGANLPALKAIILRGILSEMTRASEGDLGRAGYVSMRVEDYMWRKSEAVVSGVSGRGAAVGVGPFSDADLRILDLWRKRTVIGGGVQSSGPVEAWGRSPW